MLHQPFGLMTPSTLLQAFGAWNSLQLAQLWLPFGESRYDTAACGILPAIAALMPVPRMVTAPAAQAARRNRQRLDTSVDQIRGASVTLPSLSFGPLLNGEWVMLSQLPHCSVDGDQTPAVNWLRIDP